MAAAALLAASPPAAAAQEASAVLRRQPAASDPAPRTIVLSPTMTLRLHVGGPALRELRRGGWQALTVRLCNEMGLFDQRWPASSRVRLRLLRLPATAPSPQPNAPPAAVAAPAVVPRLSLRQVGGCEQGSGEAGGVVVRLERGRAGAGGRGEGGGGGGSRTQCNARCPRARTSP